MRWICALLLLCALGVPSVYAQQPTKKELAEAKKRFEEADAAYRLQEYEKALEGFQEAYRLSKRAGLLFNIAQCYRQLDRYEESIKSYEAFIFDAPESEYRAEAEKNITEIKALLAEQKAKEDAARLAALEAEKGDKTKKQVKALYLNAGATGAAGIASGVFFALSFRSFQRDNDLIVDAQALQREALVLKVSSIAADSLIVISLASAGAGFYLQKRYQKQKEEALKTTALLAPTQGGLQLGLSASF